MAINAVTTPSGRISAFYSLRPPESSVEDELTQSTKSGEQRERVNGGGTVTAAIS